MKQYMRLKLVEIITFVFVMGGLLLFTGCSEKEEGKLVYTDNVNLLTDKDLKSTVLNQTMKYNIILPNDYYVSSERYYPVLYLFHGMGGNNNDWANQGSVKEQVQNAIKTEVIAPIIVVMPDAFNTFYVNGYENGLQYESYFWDEFLPTIEEEYRVDAKREMRFIAGLSMGGFGASYYAFSYPDMFTYCYSMSGAIEGLGTASTPSVTSLIAQYDSFDELPDYTIDCGTSDFLLETNQNVHETLLELEFEHEYITREGGHEWVFWTKALEMVLERIGQYLD